MLVRTKPRSLRGTTETAQSSRWSAVPIENIYYLLCYAWDALDEGEALDLSPEQSLTIIDLFARVLVRGTRELLARGIDLDYTARRGAVAGIKGKLDVGATVKGITWTRGQTICTFDERGVNVPHNQILKATLRRLAALSSLAPRLATEADELAAQFTTVRDIAPSAEMFRSVRVHRNNRLYDLLIHVCRLIHDNPFLETIPGQATFPDFLGGRGEMARLFEAFIYHFYEREQREFTVRRPVIEWHAAAGTDLDMLPIMRTDVVLTARDRRIVIDTKYYERSFQQYRGSIKIRSPHLYQLLAYLQNMAAAGHAPLEGVLLYPVVDAPFHKTYTLLGHHVTVRSVDLSQPWRAIRQELLDAITSE